MTTTAPPSTVAADPSTAHLLRRTELIARRAVAWAASKQTTDPRPADPFRGLYLDRTDVLRLATERPSGALFDVAELADVEAEADRWETDGSVLRIRSLTRRFGLQPAEVELLLIALAPDLDRRFEAYYGYLHDDVGRRRASPGLALPLAGLSVVADREILSPDSTLVTSGLLLVEDVSRPFLTRSLRVPDRVCRHLLGDDRPVQIVADLLAADVPHLVGDAQALARVLSDGARLCYLRGEVGSASGWARAAFAALGSPALVLDLERLRPDEPVGAVLQAVLLEARLTGSGLVAGPIEELPAPAGIRALAELPWPTVAIGTGAWDARWSREVPLVAEVPAVSDKTRRELWRAVLDGRCAEGVDAGAVTSMFSLAPDSVARAAVSAWLTATYADRAVEAEDLRHGARNQNGGRLEGLAHRITPQVHLGDLVLPDEQHELVSELVTRARHRSVVLDQWGMRQTGRRGDGISALFAGPPGTGKTMGAEAVAGELGLDVYTVELATVVDKYIGETEKNLERIFQQAENVNGILFFDEADALFGKRSDVNDARDRYANVEVAYLLQRMEAFDGLAILATNLRMNLDEAFTRRLDVIVDFPLPDVEQRLQLWRRSFGPGAPLADDVDLEFCAASFEMSGGDIRNVALTAAYTAADAGRRVEMPDILRSVQREYRKLGRLLIQSDLGPYGYLVYRDAVR